eukprot:1188149-Prorocentrum_minimum.AAC.1
MLHVCVKRCGRGRGGVPGGLTGCYTGLTRRPGGVSFTHAVERGGLTGCYVCVCAQQRGRGGVSGGLTGCYVCVCAQQRGRG